MSIIGYTCGVFDLFHIGHLNLLRNSKAMCDKLIVGVDTDELVIKHKHKEPVIPFEERCEIVRNIKYVDVVIMRENMDKIEPWKKFKFDVMFVGDDWFQSEKWKAIEKQFKKVDVRIIYFPYTKETSSTLIKEKILNKFCKDK